MVRDNNIVTVTACVSVHRNEYLFNICRAFSYPPSHSPLQPLDAMRWLCCHPASLLSFALRWILVLGTVTYRTIDDTYGDSITQSQVEYTENWHLGQSCHKECAVHPDEAQAFEGTWHDTTSDSPETTFPHSATIKFNGAYLHRL